MKNVPVLAHVRFHSSTSLNPSTVHLLPHVCIGTIKMKDNATLAAKKIRQNKSSLHMFSHPLTKRGFLTHCTPHRCWSCVTERKKEHRPRWNKLNLQRVKNLHLQCSVHREHKGENNTKLGTLDSAIFSSRQSVCLYLNTSTIELAEKTKHLWTRMSLHSPLHTCVKITRQHRNIEWFM